MELYIQIYIKGILRILLSMAFYEIMIGFDCVLYFFDNEQNYFMFFCLFKLDIVNFEPFQDSVSKFEIFYK